MPNLACAIFGHKKIRNSMHYKDVSCPRCGIWFEGPYKWSLTSDGPTARVESERKEDNE